MTPFARRYVSYLLALGILASVSIATWQKWIWKEQHVADGVYDVEFVLWLIFYGTFMLRLYLLFVAAAVFWMTARFHQRQIKMYLLDIRQEEYEDFNEILDHLMSIKIDIKYTNQQVQGYLSVLLITVLISLIILVSGMLLSFIKLPIFMRNASDMFVMTLVVMYMLFIAAQTTQRFHDISGELQKYYHQRIALTKLPPQQMMLFLLFSANEQTGLSVFGKVLDYATVMRFCIILGSSFLSTFGKKFYS